MASAEAANGLRAKEYDGIKWNIPQRLVECLGVAFIDDVEEDDLGYLSSFEKAKSFQFDNPEIIEVRRMQKKGDNGPVPLPLVVITFAGSILPSHVELDKALYPVRQYNYPVRQCRLCWRFGHMMKQCKSKRRCNSCQMECDDEEHDCVGGPVCVNCSGDHRANDRQNCPTFRKKQEEEKKRQTSFSQGKTDWFAALAPNPSESFVVGVESTSAQHINTNSSTQSNEKEMIISIESASTTAEEDASRMKRKNAENNDFSDDEEYPPTKVRSTFVVETIISSDDDQDEREEPIKSHLTDMGEVQHTYGEKIVVEVFSDADSNSWEVGNPSGARVASLNSSGEGDTPKRL